MYFPNAFKKVYVAATTGGNINQATTGSTQNLTPGQVGLFDAKTYAAIAAAGAAGSNQTFILAQGSYHTVDKIGQFDGGYKESIKSKIINPKYVSRFFKVNAKTPLNQVLEVSDLAFTCGHTYDLRVDVKGSPALRFANHNLYKTVSAWSGCCVDDCTVTCNGDPVDQTVILLQWADQINADPLLSPFVRASVDRLDLTTTGTVSVSPTASANIKITAIADTSAISVGDRVRGIGVSGLVVSKDATSVTLDTVNTVAGTGVTVTFSSPLDSETYVPVTVSPETVDSTLRLEVAYADTVFGNCTFSTGDHYDLEPLFAYVSIVDETGNPCAIKNTVNSSPFDGATEVQAPRQASGVGETVLRDLILSQRYLQDQFPDGSNTDSIRLREILDDSSINTVTRSALYDQICILHNVPRLNNPSGTFDNDQYLLVINVPTGTVVTSFTTLVQNILNIAGNGVVLETF